RLGDGHDDAPALDPGRERLEQLRILAGEPCERIGIEPDRGAIDIAQAPLVGKHARDLVLGRPAVARDHLADALTRLAALAEGLLELVLADESRRDEQRAEGVALGRGPTVRPRRGG